MIMHSFPSAMLPGSPFHYRIFTDFMNPEEFNKLTLGIADISILYEQSQFWPRSHLELHSLHTAFSNIIFEN